ncbi:MAG: thioredoxin [Rikenellaceae bacterium]|nr:thioredoxin [Rikenellaceae bacterium]
MALNITNENYEAIVADSKPVVIDFWAEWCGPCRTIAPIVEELAEEYVDRVNIGKCDVDSADDVVATYRVRNIPTLVFIKDGNVVGKHVGAISRNDLVAKIEELL